MRIIFLIVFFVGSVLADYVHPSEFISLPSDIKGTQTLISSDGSTVVNGYSAPSVIWTEDSGARPLPLYSVDSISSDGAVVTGTYETDEGLVPAIWSRGAGLNQLPLLPGHSGGWAWSASEDATLVVGSNWKLCPNNHGHLSRCEKRAFIWTPDEGTRELDLPTSDGVTDSFNNSIAQLVSGDGRQVTGEWFEQQVGEQRLETRGLIWSNDANMHTEVIPWHDSSYSGDVVVGSSVDERGRSIAARWTGDGGVETLGTLPIPRHHESIALGISSDGEVIIGGSGGKHTDAYGTGDGSAAFVWDAHYGMRELSQVLAEEYGMTTLEGLAITNARSISQDRRKIVTTAFDNARPDTNNKPSSLIKLDWPIGPPTDDGDMNFDNIVDTTDVDIQMAAARQYPKATFHDLDFSGHVDENDLNHLIKTTFNTWFGDSNLDGEFNSSDLVAVFQAGQYEDGIDDNSGWATGDWNGDQEFTSGDLVAAFQDGGFEMGSRAALQTVPEPSGCCLLFAVAFTLAVSFRRRRTRAC